MIGARTRLQEAENLDCEQGRGARGLEISVVWAFDEGDARIGCYLRTGQGVLVVPIDAVAVVRIVGVIGSATAVSRRLRAIRST